MYALPPLATLQTHGRMLIGRALPIWNPASKIAKKYIAPQLPPVVFHGRVHKGLPMKILADTRITPAGKQTFKPILLRKEPE